MVIDYYTIALNLQLKYVTENQWIKGSCGQSHESIRIKLVTCRGWITRWLAEMNRWGTIQIEPCDKWQQGSGRRLDDAMA
jgi:hypothetical protein